jgi:hypothetical protein
LEKATEYVAVAQAKQEKEYLNVMQHGALSTYDRLLAQLAREGHQIMVVAAPKNQENEYQSVTQHQQIKKTNLSVTHHQQIKKTNLSVTQHQLIKKMHLSVIV